VTGDHATIDGRHHAAMEIRCSTTTFTIGHHPKTVEPQRNPPSEKFRRGPPTSRDGTSRLLHTWVERFRV
jgi:hypothetical protein